MLCRRFKIGIPAYDQCIFNKHYISYIILVSCFHTEHRTRIDDAVTLCWRYLGVLRGTRRELLGFPWLYTAVPPAIP